MPRSKRERKLVREGKKDNSAESVETAEALGSIPPPPVTDRELPSPLRNAKDVIEEATRAAGFSPETAALIVRHLNSHSLDSARALHEAILADGFDSSAAFDVSEMFANAGHSLRTVVHQARADERARRSVAPGEGQ